MPNDAAMDAIYTARYVRRMGEAMVIVRQYINEMEALIARSVLEAHGIPAVVLRDDAGGMLPAMRMVFPVRLAVRQADRLQALQLLDAPFEERDLTDEPFGDTDAPGAL
jgi:hypothetical protein